jgi:hypothetical protein
VGGDHGVRVDMRSGGDGAGGFGPPAHPSPTINATPTLQARSRRLMRRAGHGGVARGRSRAQLPRTLATPRAWPLGAHRDAPVCVHSCTPSAVELEPRPPRRESPAWAVVLSCVVAMGAGRLVLPERPGHQDQLGRSSLENRATHADESLVGRPRRRRPPSRRTRWSTSPRPRRRAGRRAAVPFLGPCAGSGVMQKTPAAGAFTVGSTIRKATGTSQCIPLAAMSPRPGCRTR